MSDVNAADLRRGLRAYLDVAVPVDRRELILEPVGPRGLDYLIEILFGPHGRPTLGIRFACTPRPSVRSPKGPGRASERKRHRTKVSRVLVAHNQSVGVVVEHPVLTPPEYYLVVVIVVRVA